MAPVRLDVIPQEPGIYALLDHSGQPRYIGITAKCLYERIFKRHVGGDGNSHKYSSVYNAGRMFHTRNHPNTCPIDGAVSKELRRLFAREYCHAIVIPLLGMAKAELEKIEREILCRFSRSSTKWNNSSALEAHEPSNKVDELLARIEWPSDKRAAVERQKIRWQNLA